MFEAERREFYADEVPEPDVPLTPLEKFAREIQAAFAQPIQNYILSWERRAGKNRLLEGLSAMTHAMDELGRVDMSFGTHLHASSEAYLRMGEHDPVRVKSIEIRPIETPREKALRLKKAGHSRSGAHGFDRRGRKV